MATNGHQVDGEWDLLVVGGGTAGLVGARTAASLGASVLMVERERFGGDCLWTGCVPSKSLLAAAHHVADARRAVEFGVHVGDPTVDFAAVMRHVQGVVRTIEPDDSPEALAAQGVSTRVGEVRFIAPDRATVDDEPVRARRLLLATGATPAVPPVPGLRESAHLTSDSVWDLTELPRRLVVLGGGGIGCELGQAFARLGSTVTIVEGAERLMPREDADAAALVTAALEADGVTVLTGRGVTAVEVGAGTSGHLVVGDGSDSTEVAYDRLLVAVGRSPRTRGFGLEEVGVEIDERGFLVVDAGLRTTNPRIWAAGDITGHPQFTHVAGVHGALAASNAVLGLRRKADLVIPRVTFTDPEVAAVGAATGAEVITLQHIHVDRALAERNPGGFSRIVLDGRGVVIGATVVAPRAGEMLAELTLAVRLGLKASQLARAMHPYPTFGDGPWKATIEDSHARLMKGVTARGVGLLGAIARRRSEVQ